MFGNTGDLGSLGYSLNLDESQFNARLSEVERKYSQFTQSAIAQTSGLEKSFSNALKMGAAYLTIDGAKGVVNKIITIRGEYQQLGNAMEVMLQSKAKGDKLMAEVTTLAATTPFTLSQVGQGAKQLLAYGSAAESITSELRMLGDISSGVGAEIQDLTYLYGTLRMQGRAMTIDIRQFANRGIPIYAELGKITGKTGMALQKMIEDGKIGFPQVEQAFKNLTKEGSQFGGLMAKNSQTLTGLMSNLSDAYAGMVNKIGKSQEGMLTDGIKGVTSLVNNYEPFLKLIEGAVIVYGSYRTALILTTVATNVYNAALARQTALYWAGMAATEGLTLKTLLLNTAIKANPYVLVIGSLIAMGAAMYAFGDDLSYTTQRQQEFNDTIKESKNQVTELKTNQDKLISSIKNEKTERKERQALLDNYIKTNPKILEGINLENIATDASTKKISENTFELEKNVKLKLLYANLNVSGARFNNLVDGLKGADASSYYGEYGGGSGVYKSELAKAAKQEKENLIKVSQEIAQIKNTKFAGKSKTGPTNTPTGNAEDFAKEQAKLWEEQSQLFDEYIDTLLAKEKEADEKIKEYEKAIADVRKQNLEDSTQRAIDYAEAKQKGYEAEREMIGSVGERMKQTQDQLHDDYMEKAKIKAKRDLEDFNKKLDLANQLASILSPGGAISKLTGYGTQLASIFNDSNNKKNGKFNLGLGALDIANVGLNVIAGVISGIKQRKAEAEAYYRSVIKFQQEYNLELNNQLAIEAKSSLLGDLKGQYKGQFAKAADAQKNLNVLLAKFVKGFEVQTFDSGGGFFNNQPQKGIVYLSKLLPGIINTDGSINTAKAKSYLDNQNIPIPSDVGKQQILDLIQSTLEWNQQLEDAKQAVDDLTKSIAGGLGESLRDTLTEAFRAGTDAAQDFKKDVIGVLEEISSKVLFQAVFQGAFDSLSADIKESFGLNGDNILTDDFEKFLTKYPELSSQFNNGLVALQTQASALGMDLFGNSSASGTNSDQLTGSIKSVTEETASALAGNLNMIRIMQAKQYEMIVQSVEYQKQTAQNTSHLLAIKTALSSGSLRANGVL